MAILIAIPVLSMMLGTFLAILVWIGVFVLLSIKDALPDSWIGIKVKETENWIIDKMEKLNG